MMMPLCRLANTIGTVKTVAAVMAEVVMATFLWSDIAVVVMVGISSSWGRDGNGSHDWG